jgi:hypothetical protein
MMNLPDYPQLLFVLSFVVLFASAWIGAFHLRRKRYIDEDSHEDLSTILAATLTLAGLVIGFTFSMAIGRYDQRKNFEEGEANAIGTEYLRADLLNGGDAARVRTLLQQYLHQRVTFYTARDETEARRAATRTAQLQTELWSTVLNYAHWQPNAMTALVVGGMNDVVNSQGWTQAAWLNRIPLAAWILMVSISVSCNLLFGYGSMEMQTRRAMFMVLPLVLSISFLLIAEIDSPRGGFIRVEPLNLQTLLESMGTT